MGKGSGMEFCGIGIGNGPSEERMKGDLEKGRKMEGLILDMPRL